MLYVTDGGEGVVNQAGRVHEAYRGQGVASTILDYGSCYGATPVVEIFEPQDDVKKNSHFFELVA